MTIAGVAANAEAFARILFIDPDPQRDVKRLQTHPFEIVVEMLYALFVTYCRILVRRAGPRVGRVLAAIAVHLIEMFGLGVIRLQLVVADGPRGRDAAVMTNLAKVFLAEAKERRAVEFRVAADEIIRMRMELFAVNVAPRLFRVVLR